MIDHFLMRWRVVLLGLVIAGCTKRNPRACLDGVCVDPAFPFCDVGGEIEGQADTCIAVSCTAGEFETCRDDFAITCTADGTNFDVVGCERGCEAGVGCHLCDPNETACTNGTVATCDAAGTVVSAEPCPLGCFESEPRCREIDPSNGLAQFLDMPNLPDLDLENGSITTNTGSVFANGSDVPVTTFLLAAPPNGVPIRVIPVNSLRLKNIAIDSSDVGVPAALAIVARGAVTIEGRVSVFGLAGGIYSGTCVGQTGFSDTRTASNGTTQQTLRSGGGGGGNATNGALGGAVDPLLGSGLGGVAFGNDALVPLRGGCVGSNGGAGDGGDPGGALQISSRISINVVGIVDARGASGENDAGQNGGGGAGGSVLLEAPVVVLGSNAGLIAKGGPGATGTGSAGVTPPTDDAQPALGMHCVPIAPECGDGGNGGNADTSPTIGATATYTTSPTKTQFNGGGGGGSVGRFRINTATSDFTKTSSAVEAARITTGMLLTR